MNLDSVVFNELRFHRLFWNRLVFSQSADVINCNISWDDLSLHFFADFLSVLLSHTDTQLSSLNSGRFSQVRVDSGVQEGSDISIYYDPMISKVSQDSSSPASGADGRDNVDFHL